MSTPTDDDRAGCRAAHDRLLADLADLTDEDARRPSLLPGWSVGHVLSHLARNAEGNLRMAEGVLAGEIRAMYPEGPEGRARDIEAGAARPAAVLVADLRETADALHAAWDRITPQQWGAGAGMANQGVVPGRRLVRSRWREIEVHHADLGLGFTPGDWSAAYVQADAPDLLHRLAGRPDLLDEATARELVIALLGRSGDRVRLPSVMD
jgi:maleylpyruvate isomerase